MKKIKQKTENESPLSPFAKFLNEIGNGYTFKCKKTGYVFDKWELFALGFTNVDKLKNNEYPTIICSYNENWAKEWEEAMIAHAIYLKNKKFSKLTKSLI